MLDAERWNAFVSELPGAHLLQSWQWGQVKSAHGWTPIPRIWDTDGRRAAALVLERTVRPAGLPLALRVLYVPRGPLLDWSDADLRRTVLEDMIDLARQRRAIFIKMDPELVLRTGVPGSPDDCPNPQAAEVTEELTRRGWRISDEQIQFRNTVQIDLRGEEADWLARMKQKTRYNIRLAERKGVAVRIAEEKELPLFYRMYAETAVRDGFVIRPEEYYLGVWRTFMQAGMAQPLLAEVEGEPVAGLVLFWFAGRAWYLYGMSRDVHREKMPNYLLQWEAMRLAKAQGCQMYDLWGAPDRFDESDSMWGVFRFKEGLGGTVARTPGAWDFPTRPVLYTLYTRILPRLLDLMRRRGQERIRQEVTG